MIHELISICPWNKAPTRNPLSTPIQCTKTNLLRTIQSVAKDMSSPMSLVQLCSPYPICRHQTSHRQPTNKPNEPHQLLLFTRRSATASILLLSSSFSSPDVASPFELRLTVPDQTVEEAEATIRSHAQDLLDIKPFLESESWREAQLALRESSAYLKQDIYTIIQGKPGGQRAPLRKLYSELFNNVTKLDYAARNKDAGTVKECYTNIVTALDDILSRI